MRCVALLSNKSWKIWRYMEDKAHFKVQSRPFVGRATNFSSFYENARSRETIKTAAFLQGGYEKVQTRRLMNFGERT